MQKSSAAILLLLVHCLRKREYAVEIFIVRGNFGDLYVPFDALAVFGTLDEATARAKQHIEQHQGTYGPKVAEVLRGHLGQPIEEMEEVEI